MVNTGKNWKEEQLLFHEIKFSEVKTLQLDDSKLVVTGTQVTDAKVRIGHEIKKYFFFSTDPANFSTTLKTMEIPNSEPKIMPLQNKQTGGKDYNYRLMPVVSHEDKSGAYMMVVFGDKYKIAKITTRILMPASVWY